jgi:deazaflavin-dependent oxidoreductase (nitroreductase family)
VPGTGKRSGGGSSSALAGWSGRSSAGEAVLGDDSECDAVLGDDSECDAVLSLLSAGYVPGPTLRTIGAMPLEGEYEPSPSEWVRNQVAEYESSGGQRASTLRDTGLPVIIVTTRGRTSGKIRKFALMRVEHGGEYALVASKGGAPDNPTWYANLMADPTAVMIQDGPEPFDATVREVTGDEKATWWARAVAAYPPYAEYQQNTSREIPVLVARRRA